MIAAVKIVQPESTQLKKVLRYLCSDSHVMTAALVYVVKVLCWFQCIHLIFSTTNFFAT